MYRKKTLRTMPTVTREIAEALNNMESISRKIKRLIPEIQELERDAAIVSKARVGDDGKITLRPVGFKDITQKVEDIFKVR